MKKVLYTVLMGVLCVFLNTVVCPAADKTAEQCVPGSTGSKSDPAAVKAADTAKVAVAAEKVAAPVKAAGEKVVATADKAVVTAEKSVVAAKAVVAEKAAVAADKAAVVAEKVADTADQAAATAEKAAGADAGTIEVVEIAIAKSIQDRAPQDVADTFPAGTEKIYCYTKLNGGKEGDFIIHRWKKGEEVMGEVTLKVNGSPWRTYSSKSLDEAAAGKWIVEIVQDGKVLKSKEFSIQ